MHHDQMLWSGKMYSCWLGCEIVSQILGFYFVYNKALVLNFSVILKICIKCINIHIFVVIYVERKVDVFKIKSILL